MNLFNIFWGIIKKEIILLKRYYFNTIVALIFFYVLFCVVFFGIKFFSGTGNPSFGQTTEAVIVGFMIWGLSIQGFFSISQWFHGESMWGTLEQLYMASHNFWWIVIFKIISDILFYLFFNLVLLFLMMLTTGKHLHLDIFSLIPLVIITLSGVYGIGFIMGGLALVYKRIQASFQLLQFVFVFFIVAPVDRYPFMKIFPLSLGANLIRKVMGSGVSLVELSFIDLFLLILNAIFYVSLGCFIYKLMENKAKEGGLLAHY